jgi:uncharacterized protein YbbC (DUF1343 family)
MVRTGLRRLADSAFKELRGSRLGVIAHPATVDERYRHLVDLLHGNGLTVSAVFGPEHGFRGSAQAGFSETATVDPRTGIRVYDAYNASVERWVEMFTEADAEVIVFDLQDVGARFYTFIWALYESLSAAARAGLRYLILDRPNPLGGNAFGPVLQPGFASAVGLKPIAQQHGLSMGELGLFYNGEFLGGSADLTVVECEGWRREMGGRELGLEWVAPSPNMPTVDSAIVYPGTGMIEGVNLSEGRGTTRPFELVGAPFLDHRFSDRLNAAKLPGVIFREAYFVPEFSKFTGVPCAGVELKVTGPDFDAITAGVAIIAEARRYEGFAWREEQPPFWIDKLTGSARLRDMIDAGAGVAEVVDAWQPELARYREQRESYLLYR